MNFYFFFGTRKKNWNWNWRSLESRISQTELCSAYLKFGGSLMPIA